MSRSSNISQAMADRLNALPALSGVETLVDKQKNILATVNLKVAKAGGMAVVIFYQGFDNPNAAASGLVSITRHYLVSIYAKLDVSNRIQLALCASKLGLSPH